MQRPIVSFATDAVGDWVAWLSCGHPQHVRHQPPFSLRPWVVSEAGRRERIGQPLDCVRCDEAELPAHFVAYKRTADMTESTLPAGLRRRHSTRAGVWAKIHVAAGRLRYCLEDSGVTTELAAGDVGIVVPEVPHHVEPLGAVRFAVEFYRAPTADDLHIAPLADHPEVLPVLRGWMEREWPGYYGPAGRGDAEADLRALAATAMLPVGLVALYGDQPCGMAALRAESIASHRHLTPWVTAGLVAEPHRRRGIGARLLAALEKRARALGHSRLYCATGTASGILRRAGWQVLDHAVADGEPLTIYVLDL